MTYVHIVTSVGFCDIENEIQRETHRERSGT